MIVLSCYNNISEITGCDTKEDDDAYIELGSISSMDLISVAYQISSAIVNLHYLITFY